MCFLYSAKFAYINYDVREFILLISSKVKESPTGAVDHLKAVSKIISGDELVKYYELSRELYTDPDKVLRDNTKKITIFVLAFLSFFSFWIWQIYFFIFRDDSKIKLKEAERNRSTMENNALSIDIGSGLSLASMTNQLQDSLNSKRWVIFKGWQNNRMLLDVERVRILTGYINAMNITYDAAIQLKAKQVLSGHLVQLLVDSELAKFEKEAKLNAARVRYELKKLEIDAESLDEDLISKKLSNDYTRAQNTSEFLKADLLKKIIEDLNFGEITSAQAWILSKALDPKTPMPDTDFTIKEKMLSEDLEKMKVENRRLKAKAAQEEARAEHSINNIRSFKKRDNDDAA